MEMGGGDKMNQIKTADGLNLLVNLDAQIVGIDVGTGWYVSTDDAEQYLADTEDPSGIYYPCRGRVSQEELIREVLYED